MNELANHSPSDGIAVQDGLLAFQSQAFEGVTNGMTEVQSLSDALFSWVFLYNSLFDLDAFCNERAELTVVNLLEVKAEQLLPTLRVADEAVFEHLGIPAEQVLLVKRTKELARKNDRLCAVEDANFVLQTAEVDARLAAHTCVNLAQQGRWDVDVGEPSLESACGKSA